MRPCRRLSPLARSRRPRRGRRTARQLHEDGGTTSEVRWSCRNYRGNGDGVASSVLFRVGAMVGAPEPLSVPRPPRHVIWDEARVDVAHVVDGACTARVTAGVDPVGVGATAGRPATGHLHGRVASSCAAREHSAHNRPSRSSTSKCASQSRSATSCSAFRKASSRGSSAHFVPASVTCGEQAWSTMVRSRDSRDGSRSLMPHYRARPRGVANPKKKSPRNSATGRAITSIQAGTSPVFGRSSCLRRSSSWSWL